MKGDRHRVAVLVKFKGQASVARPQSESAKESVFVVWGVPPGSLVQVVDFPTADALLSWMQGSGLLEISDTISTSADVGHRSDIARGDVAFEAEGLPDAFVPAASPPESELDGEVPSEPTQSAPPPPQADDEPSAETSMRPAPTEPPSDALAHVSGEMPATTQKGGITVVEARLSRTELTPAPGRASATAAIQVDRDGPVWVSIAARGYRLVEGVPRVQQLSMSAGSAIDTDSTIDTVRFPMEAVDPGTAEVTLVFRQRDEFPLATLRLVSLITQHEAQDERVRAQAAAVKPEAALRELPTLRIDETVADGRSYLDVGVQVGSSHVEGRVRTVDKAGLIANVYGRIAALRAERHRFPEGEDAETKRMRALIALRAIGVDLSLRLFTPEVRQFLWDRVDELDELVIQTTGEFDIPWEIVYVSDPTRSVADEPEVFVDHFLGMRGATRWVYNTALPREVVVRRGRAKYLCPDYKGPGLALSFTREEAALIKSRLHARVVRPGTAAAMSKLMASGFDLLHFAGHGVWSDAPPDQRLLLARYRRDHPTAPDTSYAASILRQDLPDALASPRPSAPRMVFLNACDVGRIDTSVVGLGGFPEAFLRGGVGVLIGCSWAVDDEIAGAFSRHFYEALESSDIGTAMKTARSQALVDDDLSALAYVAYAHPHARVTIT
ncbi:CHAT domain-containing protein [Microbacterium oryzae]|uniref:CHAT domain-containing protein n=1 Tax=Microbacterium oryzae TaxID=743009 RepID=UPI0015677A72|nr:CHAT domain-containing protein [Microbacterium oryzae]